MSQLHSRFNLIRYFSMASLIVFVIATFIVGVLSYFRAREALLNSSEEYAASIAHNISFQLATDPIFKLQTSDAGISLNAPDTPQTLGDLLPGRLFGLKLDQVSVFDLQGRIIFSTNPADIGEIESENKGIATALTGQTFSTYGTIPQDQRPQNFPGAFIETYSPLYARVESLTPQSIVGVVEIYRDVTTLDNELARSAFIAAGTVGGAMLLLYLALLIIIRRADGILNTQRGELEASNSQLHQLQQYRDDLTGMVVHDLRNPMTSIIGNLSMLREDSVSFDSEQQAMVLSSMQSSEEVMTMLNDLLSVNRMEQGSVALKRDSFPAADWLDARVTRLEGAAHRQSVRLLVEVVPINLQINGDKQLLSRVVDNLVTNALHYTGKGGEIRLTAQRNGNGESVISISDNGEGIAPSVVPHIFEKFYRGDNQTRHATGAGLGLAFCKLAVEAHKGRIWVESVQGKGSTFSFTIGKAN